MIFKWRNEYKYFDRDFGRGKSFQFPVEICVTICVFFCGKMVGKLVKGFCVAVCLYGLYMSVHVFRIKVEITLKLFQTLPYNHLQLSFILVSPFTPISIFSKEFLFVPFSLCFFRNEIYSSRSHDTTRPKKKRSAKGQKLFGHRLMRRHKYINCVSQVACIVARSRKACESFLQMNLDKGFASGAWVKMGVKENNPH